MNRLSFSRTQILILLSVWLTFLVEFCNAFILVFCYAYPQRGFALYCKDGAQHISAFYFGYAFNSIAGWYLSRQNWL